MFVGEFNYSIIKNSFKNFGQVRYKRDGTIVLLHAVLSPFLKIGTTSAVLNISGQLPLSKHKFIICTKIGVM